MSKMIDLIKAEENPNGTLKIVATNFTVSTGEKLDLLVDTSNSPITLKLPTNPSPMQVLTIRDLKARFHVNALTIDGNGKSIMSASATIIVDSEGASMRLIYDGDWRIF